MWASRYWADRQWAPRYWAKEGGTPPPPGAGGLDDKFTLGTKESLSVTSQPTLGGRFTW